MRPRLTNCRSLLSGCGKTTTPAGFFSSSVSRSNPLRAPLNIPPPFPVTQKCPEPACSCPATPDMPEGLPIDFDQSLNGTMAAYTQQVVICTGQRDWATRIEDDGKGQSWGELVRGLKKLMGRGGRYADPFNNVLVSNSSFSPSSSTATASAFLFPRFIYIPSISVNVSEEQNVQTDLATFVQAFLLPEQLNPMQDSLPESKRAKLTRKPELASNFPDAVDIQYSPVVLICGHGGRDMRCGVMAPVLEKEFSRVLRARGFSSAGADGNSTDSPEHAHVGLISHVGGHKYAGNVIVYIPPGMKAGGSPHPLAGKGIWYGRVEPKHVQGIIDETIMSGRVVLDHFRGGVDRNGDILRV